jgi:hypothetical protein
MRISGKHKQAIRADLLGMSRIIEQALDYTKNKALEKRETVVEYWLNTNTGDDWYILRIFYEQELEGWNCSLQKTSGDRSVGELVSGKQRFMQILLDEDAEKEEI